jgi:hypothetical protein
MCEDVADRRFMVLRLGLKVRERERAETWNTRENVQKGERTESNAER